MTVKELADLLYAKIKDKPELANTEIRSMQLDIAATTKNLKIDLDKWYADIYNWNLS
jgi:hypothetical protein